MRFRVCVLYHGRAQDESAARHMVESVLADIAQIDNEINAAISDIM
jgi:hypothetical protein